MRWLPAGWRGQPSPGTIVITPSSAQDLTVLARIAGIRNARVRYAYYRECADQCVNAAMLALHEMAHEVQWATGAMGIDEARTEGQAESVALDLEPGFIRYLIGRNPSERWWRPDTAWDYRLYVATLRRASAVATGGPWTSPAARWWRYRQLGAVGAS